MILAAGRGERLRPLTDTVPKPLLSIGGETLIERHISRLAAAGITEIVVNLSHLGEQIEHCLGTGAAQGVNLHYSHEPEGALETAGGIVAALPWLGDAPFIVVNGDIWTDFDFVTLALDSGRPCIVLVPNPAHHPDGDFAFVDGLARRDRPRELTYAGIAVFDAGFFSGLSPGRRPLGPMLFEAAARGVLSARIHAGRWFDIGTLERLESARRAVGDGAA